MTYDYTLYEIPLYRMGGSDNWMKLPVLATSDESFKIQTARSELHFRDEDLKPNADGKYIINIEKIDLGQNCVDIKEFEMPFEVMEYRKERRRVNALEKNTICIDSSVDPIRYFYLEGDKLRVLQGEKQVTVDKIEVVHGKEAVLAKDLGGHPYIELPPVVAETFGNILWEKEIKNLALEHVGQNQITGHEYYKLNMGISSQMWSQVEGYFECFGTDGTLQGWLTSEPEVVSQILNNIILTMSHYKVKRHH